MGAVSGSAWKRSGRSSPTLVTAPATGNTQCIAAHDLDPADRPDRPGHGQGSVLLLRAHRHRARSLGSLHRRVPHRRRRVEVRRADASRSTVGRPGRCSCRPTQEPRHRRDLLPSPADCLVGEGLVLAGRSRVIATSRPAFRSTSGVRDSCRVRSIWLSTAPRPAIASGNSCCTTTASGGAVTTGRSNTGLGWPLRVSTIWPSSLFSPTTGPPCRLGRRPRRRSKRIWLAGTDDRRSPIARPTWPPTVGSLIWVGSAWPPRCATSAVSVWRGCSWLPPGPPPASILRRPVGPCGAGRDVPGWPGALRRGHPGGMVALAMVKTDCLSPIWGVESNRRSMLDASDGIVGGSRPGNPSTTWTRRHVPRASGSSTIDHRLRRPVRRPDLDRGAGRARWSGCAPRSRRRRRRSKRWPRPARPRSTAGSTPATARQLNSSPIRPA